MNKLPVMLLKELVLLPMQEVRLELNTDISKKVVQIATKNHDSQLLIVCPKDQIEEEPSVNDLPIIGVVGKIRSRIELPNGNFRVTITGLKRVEILEYFNSSSEDDVLAANVNEVVLPKFDEIEESALYRQLDTILKEYIKVTPYVSNTVLNQVKGITDLYRLTDIITAFVPFSTLKKLEYMQEINAMKRAKKLVLDLSVEMQVILLDSKLDEELQEELEQNQRDFILKEKLRQLKEELGEESSKESEITSFKEQLAKLTMNDKTRAKILNEIYKYEHTPDMSPDASVLANYLDWILHLPWNEQTKDETNLNKIRTCLDKSHYGLEKIKERIIEFIAVKQRNLALKSPILCFVGPPGVGKTSLAIEIAKSLHREFYKISVGGLNDSAELVGHRRTYLGANPGKIIQGLKKCGSKNPVFLIDEIDKMVKDYKGDPASALLDILDPEQNTMFVDNYIEEPFDLSQVLFLLTANDEYHIPEALYDRLEIIRLSSYTELEKIDIAKKYLLPNIYQDHLVTKKEIKFSDDIIRDIICSYTKEAGVRELSRCLSTIVRKVVTESIRKKQEPHKTITKKDLKGYLGSALYGMQEWGSTTSFGLVNGLAVTNFGGILAPIESCIYEGKGKILFTGLPGKVMNESLDVAYSYVRTHKDDFLVNDYFFDHKNIHLHLLDGAIPKDGPSAGVTIVTSALSLVLRKMVPKHVAMTGEISLRGDVLSVGGIKEKVIGGYNGGARIFYLPYGNKKDEDDIPKEILKEITIYWVKNYQEIYDGLFRDA